MKFLPACLITMFWGATALCAVAPPPKTNTFAANAVAPIAPLGAPVEVDHLGQELQPEDYAALANPNIRGFLPPVEFAHPYHGEVLLLRGQSQEALRRICGQQPEGTLLGCARRPSAGELPFVVMADDATVRAVGWTPNLNALHEAGHLNGSWGHDGWRDLAQLGVGKTRSQPSLPEVSAPKPVIVAQADAPVEEDEPPPPPPRRHPRPREHYGYPPPPPPPRVLYEPWSQRAIPCLPTLLTLGVIRFCI